MSRKKHVVEFSEEERQEFERFTSEGAHRAEDINRARILLKADDGLTDAQINEYIGCSIGTPYRTRKAYSERGVAAMNRRKPDRDYTPKLDGCDEAHLIALACSEPPEGRTCWTYVLLADRLVTFEQIEFDSISEEIVRQRVKNDLKPHRSEYWLIPPKENAEFVYRMETLLSLYQEPYDESCPIVHFDESSKTLRKHVRDPLPAAPGAIARTDHHYKRNGKRMLHVATDPLTGQCRLHVTKRRRTCEWIDCVVAIADDYPDADRIRVVLDNLSTHNPAAFYRSIQPEKAREYLDLFVPC